MAEKQVLQLVYHSADVGWRNGYRGEGDIMFSHIKMALKHRIPYSETEVERKQRQDYRKRIETRAETEKDKE